MFPVLPSVIVHLIQDPLVVWLTATRVGAGTVAEVFALGRIGAIFAIINVFTATLVLPLLSNIKKDDAFLRAVAQSIAILSLAVFAGLLITYYEPHVLLWLIGAQYGHLSGELVLAVAVAELNVLSSFFVLINRLRGWVGLDPFFAVLQLVLILLSAVSWDLNSTWNVLELNLVLSLFGVAIAISIFIVGLLNPKAASAA
jgi:hypothetical protein